MLLALPKTAGPARIKRSLALEIAAALAFKAGALVILYVAFFGPAHRVDVSAERAAQILLDRAAAEPRR